MQSYMFLLYLEYARLVSPDRDNGKMVRPPSLVNTQCYSVLRQLSTTDEYRTSISEAKHPHQRPLAAKPTRHIRARPSRRVSRIPLPIRPSRRGSELRSRMRIVPQGRWRLL